MIQKIIHEMFFSSPEFSLVNIMSTSRTGVKFQHKVHTSLGVVEEMLSSVGKTSGDVRESCLGLLYSTEKHEVYPLVKSIFRWYKQRFNIFMPIHV
jgi:hypothetical protein